MRIRRTGIFEIFDVENQTGQVTYRMDDGIYSNLISSKNEPVAEGIVVLNGRTLNGGGRGYLFRGECSLQGDTLNCEIFSYRQDEATIFGEKEYYSLRLKRDTKKEVLVFTGPVDQSPELTLTAELIWRASLMR